MRPAVIALIRTPTCGLWRSVSSLYSIPIRLFGRSGGRVPASPAVPRFIREADARAQKIIDEERKVREEKEKKVNSKKMKAKTNEKESDEDEDDDEDDEDSIDFDSAKASSPPIPKYKGKSFSAVEALKKAEREESPIGGLFGRSVGGEPTAASSIFILRERDLDESFVKGTGRGGQKVNKTSNCVLLKHIPTGTIVRCHTTRSLHENREIARKRMSEKLKELVLGVNEAQMETKAKRNKLKRKYRKRREEKMEEIKKRVMEMEKNAVGGEEKTSSSPPQRSEIVVPPEVYPPPPLHAHLDEIHQPRAPSVFKAPSIALRRRVLVHTIKLQKRILDSLEAVNIAAINPKSILVEKKIKWGKSGRPSKKDVEAAESAMESAEEMNLQRAALRERREHRLMERDRKKSMKRSIKKNEKERKRELVNMELEKGEQALDDMKTKEENEDDEDWDEDEDEDGEEGGEEDIEEEIEDKKSVEKDGKTAEQQ